MHAHLDIVYDKISDFLLSSLMLVFVTKLDWINLFTYTSKGLDIILILIHVNYGGKKNDCVTSIYSLMKRKLMLFCF